uniref:Uncharacterized protein n=1 Tax=Plectus sambesii TaxID=2011161 RepID=A0A914UXS2_9BILA
MNPLPPPSPPSSLVPSPVRRSSIVQYATDANSSMFADVKTNLGRVDADIFRTGAIARRRSPPPVDEGTARGSRLSDERGGRFVATWRQIVAGYEHPRRTPCLEGGVR